MGTFNHDRYHIWAILLVASFTTAITAPDNIGNFEVDLLFPSNSTYTPQALMPIVFAVQNPTLVFRFGASFNWSLWEGNNQTSPGSIVGGLESFQPISPPNQTLVTRIINTMAYPDGVWTLAWSISFLNCTVEGTPAFEDSIYLNSTTTFTVSASGRAPDLVAETSAQMCGTANSLALSQNPLGRSCGMPSPEPATATPCAMTINSTAASSIYAAATEMACSIDERQANPNVTCPTAKPSASSPGVAGRIAAASTLLMLLTMFTALIYLR
jgi:hypothetical protein